MNTLAIVPLGNEIESSVRNGTVTYRGMVYPWHCDHMGHMNVMWYTGKFDEASWSLLTQIGVTPAYLRDHARRMAAVEQTFTYRQELFAGDLVTVRSTLLGVGGSSMRFSHAMHKEGSDEPAAFCVAVGVHLDAQTRRPCPLPAEIAARARRLIPT